MGLHVVPEWIRHAPKPGVQGFALLTGLDAAVRGSLISVWPVVAYDALGSAAAVSRLYFLVGLVALAAALATPWLGRAMPRRWVYTLGTALYLAGPALAVHGSDRAIAAGLGLTTIGTVLTFVSLNAYVMDYIARHELGRGESLKLVYGALPWAVGPVAGVWLWKLWAPAPFLLAMGFGAALAAVFWAMRLGNGKLIQRARGRPPNPLAYLGRFLAQPRLVAGWLFAVIRSCGWWVYVVYLPIFCIEAGLGDRVGGMALSLSNTLLLLAPLMLRWMNAHSLRHAVRAGFFGSAAFFCLSSFGEAVPAAAVAALFAGSFFLVLLDMCGGLPFLMAVKPSERAEMSAVYSSFRDVSGIATPGVAWLVLQAAPVTGIFAACGLALFVAWGVAGRINPRLGATVRRPASAQQPPRDDLRLDLGRALEDVEDPRVAQDPADPVFQREAVAAVNLQRVVRRGPGDAGA